MKKTILLILSSFVIQIFCSCLQNEFEPVLFRTMNDPSYDVPEIDFLSKENTIYLNWKADDACDKYILLRSVDSEILNFKPVYEGRDLFYIDESLTEQARYVYRLDKRRGAVTFTGKEYAFGFASPARNDFCEPNDDYQDATLLHLDFECSLPCIKFKASNEPFLDADCFCVDVPARRTAEIVIKQKQINNSDESIEDGKPTNMFFQQACGNVPVQIKQGEGIQVSNTDCVARRLYFKVYPNTDELFSPYSFSTVIEYSISLNRIINYTTN